MINILLVEDDETIAQALNFSFLKEGFSVCNAKRVGDALSFAAKESFDIAILDINLPDGNGIELCKIFKREYNFPIIFLTVKDDEETTVLCLDIGADDYVKKPFRLKELISRVNAVTRRNKKINEQIVIGKGLILDTQKGTVSYNNNPVYLSALEYRLLTIFANNMGKVLDRNALLRDVWDIDGNFVNDNTLSVYIKRLRSKIETEDTGKLIVTVRGLGYRLENYHV